ncbi:hypothetical protein Tco_1244782 [Tanacetum coccineum]
MPRGTTQVVTRGASNDCVSDCAGGRWRLDQSDGDTWHWRVSVRAEEIERNRVHEETMQMLREMIKIQEEKRIFEETARQEEEKRIAKEKEAAELEAKRKSQECLNIEEKSIPQASTRSRKSRIDPTLRNFTISTKQSLLFITHRLIPTKIRFYLMKFSLPTSEESNSEISDATIESLSPLPILIEDSDSLMEEVDLFLASDDSMPSGIEIDYYDSEGDICFLEELLSSNSPPLPENESFSLDHFDDPSSFSTSSKVVGDISEHDVLMPNILPTQPTLCPVFALLLLFSSENEDKVFKPGIFSSPFLSHRAKITFDFSESPMMISGGDIPHLDVPYPIFNLLDQNQETDIQEQDEKQSQKQQNRARNGKDKVKSKPNFVTLSSFRNEESKKMQKSFLKQEFKEFKITKAEVRPENEDVNLKFLRALPLSWSQVTLVLKTKGGLEYLSFDDLYNKLKSLEFDVKGYAPKPSSLANAAFVSTASTNNNNDTRSNHSPSYSTSSSYSGNREAYSSHGSVVDDVIHSFLAESEPKQQLAYEDLKQIEKLDLEELDLK